MDDIYTSLSGIEAANIRAAVAANNIANLNTAGVGSQEAVQSAGPAGVQITLSSSTALNTATSNVDAASQMVALIIAEHDVKFNATVTGAVLDLLA